MDEIQRWITSRTIRSQIPNILTMSRLFLGLMFPWLPAGAWVPALIWGTLSEFLDGFLARRMHAVSSFGQLMDPIADKIFVMAAALTFLNADLISLPQLIFVASRDLFVALSCLVLLLRRHLALFLDMPPSMLGKWTTALQLLTLFALPLLPEHTEIFIYPSGLVSMLAAVDYARRFLQRSQA